MLKAEIIIKKNINLFKRILSYLKKFRLDFLFKKWLTESTF